MTSTLSRFHWERLLPWFVLLVLLFYTHTAFFRVPYPGFRWQSSDDRVTELYVAPSPQSQQTLQEGDRLLAIDSVRLSDFDARLRQTLFTGVQAGDVIALEVERNGERFTIPWTYSGPTRAAVLERLNSEWALCYIFWLAGSATLLLIRPRDTRWQLLVAFNFLTAVWLAAGSGGSRWHLSESAIVLRAVIWLCVPVYLHLHWVFPVPLGRLPRLVLVAGYAFGAGMAIAQWFEWVPASSYFSGFLLSIFGSLILLLAHFIFRPAHRRELGLLLTLAAFALVPVLGVGLAGFVNPSVPTTGGVLLALPALPLAYFYVISRRRLGPLELRVNRVISFYLFSVLLGPLVAILVTLLHLQFQPAEAAVLVSLVAAFLAVAGILVFPSFQRLVERRVLGVPEPPSLLLPHYITRIATTLDLAGLVELLREEFLPGLLVRQWALLRLDSEGQLTALDVNEVSLDEHATEKNVSELLAHPARYRFPTSSERSVDPLEWVRLALPLRHGEQLIGVWLLGRRDPDDFYAQVEIPVLQAIADQVALTLVNISATEQIRKLYQANINRHEQERSFLALALHDEVLNEMAALAMSVDEETSSPQFQASYEAVTSRIRQMITGLRPTMLNYGLHYALEEFLDDLAARTGNNPAIQLDLPVSGGRYPPHVEQHLFRIVQQAAENALRHARASTLCVQGRLEPDQLVLLVEDNGVGFPTEANMDLVALLERRHFGVAGMFERAALIGAELQIRSVPQQGTQMRVIWRSDASPKGLDNSFTPITSPAPKVLEDLLKAGPQ